MPESDLIIDTEGVANDTPAMTQLDPNVRLKSCITTSFNLALSTAASKDRLKFLKGLPWASQKTYLPL